MASGRYCLGVVADALDSHFLSMGGEVPEKVSGLGREATQILEPGRAIIEGKLGQLETNDQVLQGVTHRDRVRVGKPGLGLVELRSGLLEGARTYGGAKALTLSLEDLVVREELLIRDGRHGP